MRKQTTIHSRRAGAPRAVPALLGAALVLGGCSATHVGDDWQCPVAQGAACTSVAEADPAVKKEDQAQEPAIPELPGAGVAGGSGAACAGGCDPFAWLAEWLGGLEEPGDVAAHAEPASVPTGEELPEVSGGNLRTKERIARIWIAPFVDSGGVYREGHWVRTVVEPARWRLR